MNLISSTTSIINHISTRLGYSTIDVIPFEIMFLFFLIFILFIYNLKGFLILSKKISRNTKVILFLIILLSFILRMSVPHLHLAYLDEPYYGAVAKNMLLHNKAAEQYYSSPDETYFLKSKQNFGWSLSIQIAYFFFGINDFVAIYLNTIIGTITIAFIFLLSYILFKDEHIALWSAFLYSTLIYHVIWSATSENNILALLIVILIFIFLFIYFKTRSFNSHLLTLLLLGFVVQIRMEYLLLIPAIIMSYFLFIKNLSKHVYNKSFIFPWIILILIIILFYIPIFSTMFQGANTSYSIKIITAQLSLELWKSFHNIYQPSLLLAFLVLGLVYAFSNYKKQLALILAIYIPLILFYASWVDLRGRYRYFFINLLCIILIQSVGIKAIATRLNKRIKKKSTKKWILFLFNACLIIFIIISYSITISNHYNYGIDYRKLSTALPSIIEKDLENNNCFIISEYEDAVTLSAGTNLRIVPLNKFVQKDVQDSFLESKNCLLYYEGMSCKWKRDTQNNERQCEIMNNKFNLSLSKSYRFKSIRYDLYDVKQKSLKKDFI